MDALDTRYVNVDEVIEQEQVDTLTASTINLINNGKIFFTDLTEQETAYSEGIIDDKITAIFTDDKTYTGKNQ